MDFDLSSLLGAYEDKKSIRSTNSMPPVAKLSHASQEIFSYDEDSSTINSTPVSTMEPLATASSSIHERAQDPEVPVKKKQWILDVISDSAEMRSTDRSVTTAISKQDSIPSSDSTRAPNQQWRSFTAPTSTKIDLNRVATMTKSFMAEELAILDSIGNFDLDGDALSSLKKLEARRETNKRPLLPKIDADIETKSSNLKDPETESESKSGSIRTRISSTLISSLETSASKNKDLPTLQTSSTRDCLNSSSVMETSSPATTTRTLSPVAGSPNGIVPRKQVPRKPIPLTSPVHLTASPSHSALEQYTADQKSLTSSPSLPLDEEQGSPIADQKRLRKKLFGRSSEHKLTSNNYNVSPDMKSSSQFRHKLRDFMQMDALGVTPDTREQVLRQQQQSANSLPSFERADSAKMNGLSGSPSFNVKLGLKGLRGKLQKKGAKETGESKSASSFFYDDRQFSFDSTRDESQLSQYASLQEAYILSDPDTMPTSMPATKASGLGIAYSPETDSPGKFAKRTVDPVMTFQQTSKSTSSADDLLDVQSGSKLSDSYDGDADRATDGISKLSGTGSEAAKATIPTRGASLTGPGSNAPIRREADTGSIEYVSESEEDEDLQHDTKEIEADIPTTYKSPPRVAQSDRAELIISSTESIKSDSQMPESAASDRSLTSFGGPLPSIPSLASRGTLAKSESYSTVYSSLEKKSATGSEAPLSATSEQESEEVCICLYVLVFHDRLLTQHIQFLDAIEERVITPSQSSPSRSIPAESIPLSSSNPVMKKDISSHSLMRRKRRSSMPEWSPIATMVCFFKLFALQDIYLLF